MGSPPRLTTQPPSRSRRQNSGAADDQSREAGSDLTREDESTPIGGRSRPSFRSLSILHVRGSAIHGPGLACSQSVSSIGCLGQSAALAGPRQVHSSAIWVRRRAKARVLGLPRRDGTASWLSKQLAKRHVRSPISFWPGDSDWAAAYGLYYGAIVWLRCGQEAEIERALGATSSRMAPWVLPWPAGPSCQLRRIS